MKHSLRYKSLGVMMVLVACTCDAWPPPRVHLINVDPLNQIPNVQLGITSRELLQRRLKWKPAPYNGYTEWIGRYKILYTVSEKLYSEENQPSPNSRIISISASHRITADMDPQQEWALKFSEISKAIPDKPICLRFTEPDQGMIAFWKSSQGLIALGVHSGPI